MKKFLTLFMIFTMLSLSCLGAFAETDNKETAETSQTETTAASNAETLAEYDLAIGLINALCPDAVPNTKGVFKRDEFVGAVIGVMGDLSQGVFTSEFLDVDSKNPYYARICVAQNMGIVSNGTLFYPKQEITFSQALKIVMNALGYDKHATAMGGYPAGYYACAARTDVLEGVDASADEPLSYLNGAKLIYNMLHEDMIEIQSVGLGESYQKTEGRTLLSVYGHINMIDGIVEANEYTALNNSSLHTAKNYINIDGRLFQAEGMQSYIGQNVRAYYEDTDDQPIVYMHARNNELVAFGAEDSLSLSGKQISCIAEDGKTTNYKLDDSYVVLYNNQYFSSSDYAPYIESRDSVVSLIDNNRDGRYEVVSVQKPNYMVLSGVDTENEVLYDLYKVGGSVNLSQGDVTYTVYSAEGEPMTLADLKAGDVLGVFRSGNQKLYIVQVYAGYTTGIITGYDTDHVFVDGVSHSLSNYYRQNKNLLRLGADVICFFGEKEQVVEIDYYPSEAQYGYFIRAKKEGISSDVQIKFFSQEGKMEIASLAAKIDLNHDSKTKREDAYTFLNSLLTGDDGLRVFRYKLNKEGMISQILTAQAMTDLASAAKASYYEGRPLLFCSQSCYYRSGIFSPRFHGDSKTLYIKVPASASLKDSDDAYELVTSAQLSTGSYDVVAYDVDAGGAAAFVVIKADDGMGEVSETTVSAIVERSYIGVNKDGDEVYCVSLYSSSGSAVYYPGKNTTDDVKKLKPGDVVRVLVNSQNEITAVNVDFEYATKTFDSGVAESSKIGGAAVEYLSGRVYGCVGNYAYLLPVTKDIAGKVLPEDVKCSALGSNLLFVKFVYDKDHVIQKAKITSGTSAEIKSWFNSGNSADYLISRQRYRAPSLTFVYSNAYN